MNDMQRSEPIEGYYTLDEVAAEIGVSRQAIQQQEKKLLRKLRDSKLKDWVSALEKDSDCEYADGYNWAKHY